MIFQAWQSGDTGALKGLLAENATFSSPVTDYVGSQNASHVLGLIAQVLEDVRPGPEWNTGDETVSAFTARCQGAEMQGMLREQRDASGALVHVTLFPRPYRTLRAAIARMGELLDRNPVQAGGALACRPPARTVPAAAATVVKLTNPARATAPSPASRSADRPPAARSWPCSTSSAVGRPCGSSGNCGRRPGRSPSASCVPPAATSPPAC